MPRELDLTLLPMHPRQADIFNSPARFRVACAGRRFGKGICVSNCEIYTAARGGNVWHVARDYPTSEIHWRLLRSLANQIPIATVRESEHMVTFEGTPGYIQIKSAGAGLRGEGLDLLVLEEAAHIPDLETLWTEDLRPTRYPTGKAGRCLPARPTA